MAGENALALLVRTPEINLGDSLMAASRAQQAVTASQLGQLQLRQATQRDSALTQYATARDNGDPNALSALNRFPDIQGAARENMSADQAYKMQLNARDAQYVAGFADDPQRQEQALQEKLALAQREGRIDAATAQRVGGLRGLQLHSALQGIIQQAQKIPSALELEQIKALQRRELPKFQEIGENVDQFGQKTKRFGFVDNEAGTATPARNQDSTAGLATEELAGTGLRGEAYLETLPGGSRGPIATQLKAYATGRQPLPTGFAAAKPYAQRMLQMLGQYDETFDFTSASARKKLRDSFEGGKDKDTIGSGNTAIQHLGEMTDAIKGLGNYSGMGPFNRSLNAGRNAYQEQSGTAQNIEAFRSFRDKYAEEATKFYRGIGGSESDIQREIAALNEAKSPAELQTQALSQIKLMAGKINSLQDRWKTGMGPLAGEFPLIDDKSRQAIAKAVNNAKTAGIKVSPEIEHMTGAFGGNQPKRLPARAQASADQGAVPSEAVRLLISRPTPEIIQQFEQKYGVSAKQFLDQEVD